MTGTSNAGTRTMDMPVLDGMFGMEDGYVLDFSNRTFADFFREDPNADIDHPRWAAQGGGGVPARGRGAAEAIQLKRRGYSPNLLQAALFNMCPVSVAHFSGFQQVLQIKCPARRTGPQSLDNKIGLHPSEDRTE